MERPYYFCSTSPKAGDPEITLNCRKSRGKNGRGELAVLPAVHSISSIYIVQQSNRSMHAEYDQSHAGENSTSMHGGFSCDFLKFSMISGSPAFSDVEQK